MGRRYTLDDVRRSFTPEKQWEELQGDLPSTLIYRPISFWITPLLLRLGLSPTAVTASRGLLVGAIGAALFFAGAQTWMWVVGLGFVFHVLDCADGNMARTTGRFSDFGALLDGFIDFCYWSVLFVALGVLVERSARSPLLASRGVELGLGLVVLVLLSRQTRDRYELIYDARSDFLPTRPEHLGLLIWVRIGFIGLETLYVFFIALGALFDVMEGVFWAIAAYVIVMFVGGVGEALLTSLRAGPAAATSAPDRPAPGSSRTESPDSTGERPPRGK